MIPLPNVLAEGQNLLGTLLSMIPMLILIGAMIWGFKLAGRWAKSVPMQMLLGVLLGFGILFGVVCVLFGVLFAGCLIMGSPSFH